MSSGIDPGRNGELQSNPEDNTSFEGNDAVWFYLVRHGETDYNKSNRLQGHIDTRLNENGKLQALRLASSLNPLRIGAIYSSDLRRAYETAEIISGEISVPIAGKSQDLREATFGELEGKTYSEISEMMGVPVEAFMTAGLDTIADVESRHSVASRSLAFLEHIAGQNYGKKLLVVTHGGVMRSISSKLLEKDLSYLYFANGEVLEVGYNGGKWLVRLPESKE